MKRYVLILLGITIINCSSAYSQWKVGGNLAAASGGTTTQAYDLSFGVDAYYMYRNPDAFFKYGFNASLLFAPGKETDIPKDGTAAFIPLSFATRLTFFKVFTMGPDLGYGVSLNGNVPGGFYIKGIIGLDIANTFELNLFLSNVNAGENNNFTSGGAGFLINIY